MRNLPPHATDAKYWAASRLSNAPAPWFAIFRTERLVTIGVARHMKPVKLRYYTPNSTVTQYLSIEPQQDSYASSLCWVRVITEGTRLYYRPNGVRMKRPNILIVADDTPAAIEARTNSAYAEATWVNALRIEHLTGMAQSEVRRRLNRTRYRHARSAIAAKRLRDIMASDEAVAFVNSLLCHEEAALFEALDAIPALSIIAEAREKLRRKFLEDVPAWL
jgi:hypothetical protein